MIVQLYRDGLLRAFKDHNSSSIFEVQNVTYRELDLLGLPRLGKPLGKPWERYSWGWEIEVNFKCALTKRAADVKPQSPRKNKSRKASRG